MNLKFTICVLTGISLDLTYFGQIDCADCVIFLIIISLPKQQKSKYLIGLKKRCFN